MKAGPEEWPLWTWRFIFTAVPADKSRKYASNYYFFFIRLGRCWDLSQTYIFSVPPSKCWNCAWNCFFFSFWRQVSEFCFKFIYFFQSLKASVRILPQIYIFFSVPPGKLRIVPQIRILFLISPRKMSKFASNSYFVQIRHEYVRILLQMYIFLVYPGKC